MDNRLSIVIHDYAGHPFPFELSIEFAERGYLVHHIYSAAVDGVKADFEIANLCQNLTVQSVSIGRVSSKTKFFQRVVDEVVYGFKVTKAIRRIKSDYVISTNVPLLPYLISRIGTNNRKHIFWMQDLLGLAAQEILGQEYGSLGKLVGFVFKKIEVFLLKKASKIVVICWDFKKYLKLHYGISEDFISVIENWAPLSLMRLSGEQRKIRDNGRLVRTLMYSGTLGYKHRPEDVFKLAKQIENASLNWRVVVACSGYGRDVLENLQRVDVCQHLELCDPVPYRDLTDFLDKADIFIATLENGGSRYCVPSKVLTYMALARPTILIGPKENRISQILSDTISGITVEQLQDSHLDASIMELLSDDSMIRAMGYNAASYSHDNFQVKQKANVFENLLVE